MPNKSQPKKCRNFMYEQQVSYLPNGMTPDKLYEHVEQTMKPNELQLFFMIKTPRKIMLRLPKLIYI